LEFVHSNLRGMVSGRAAQLADAAELQLNAKRRLGEMLVKAKAARSAPASRRKRMLPAK
jgi:hypothetical protein